MSIRGAPAGRRPGPGESALDQEGDDREQRRREEEQHEATLTIEAALQPARRRVIRTAGRPSSGRPSIAWMSDGRTRRPRRGGARRRPGRRRSRSERTTASVSSCGSLENATTTARRRARLTMSASSSGRRDRARRRGRSAAPSGSSSTKPTRSRPYSGCWTILRPISWPTSPAPTMSVFCRYPTRRRPIDRASARAGSRTEAREQPEGRHPSSDARVGAGDQRGTAVGGPDADRDEVEEGHASSAVDPCDASLGVAVVETELRSDDPERQSREEDCCVAKLRSAPIRRRAVPTGTPRGGPRCRRAGAGGERASPAGRVPMTKRPRRARAGARPAAPAYLPGRRASPTRPRCSLSSPFRFRPQRRMLTAASWVPPELPPFIHPLPRSSRSKRLVAADERRRRRAERSAQSRLPFRGYAILMIAPRPAAIPTRKASSPTFRHRSARASAPLPAGLQRTPRRGTGVPRVARLRARPAVASARDAGPRRPRSARARGPLRSDAWTGRHRTGGR